MITITRPEPEDVEAIHNVMKTSWYATYPNKEVGVTKEDGDLIYSPEVERKQIEALKYRALNPKENDVSFVAKDGEKVIGYIRLKIADSSVDLVSLYVDPKYTGMGVGSQLWAESKKNIPNDKKVYVEVVSYTEAKNFYKKNGFVEIDNYLEKESMLSSRTHFPITKMVFKNTEKAFLWITGLLEEHSIQYKISGGFAARIYGVQRDLADIDIEISKQDILKISELAKDNIIYGPSRFKDDHWDLELMTLCYDGQDIDISENEAKIFNKQSGAWEVIHSDLAKFELLEIYNKKVPIEEKNSLINYKNKLSREVDLEDIRQLSVEVQT